MMTLLGILLEKEQTTVSELAKKSALSEKTVRTSLDKLIEFLRTNEYGHIEKKPRVGILMKLSEDKKIELTKLIDYGSLISLNPIKREHEILNIILRSENTIPTSKLKIANELFISVPTVNRSLKEVKRILNQNNIELVSIRNKGLKLIYSENNFRHFVKKVIMHKNVNVNKVVDKINLYLPNLNIQKIIEICKAPHYSIQNKPFMFKFLQHLH